MANTLTLKTLNTRIDALEQAQKADHDLIVQIYNSVVGGKKKTNERGNAQPTVEKVAYTKANGETVMASPAQVAVWEAHKANQTKFEAMKAEWQTKREGYKPSKKLVDAIKSDRVGVTFAKAKELGFVGTKADLQALKAKLCK